MKIQNNKILLIAILVVSLSTVRAQNNSGQYAEAGLPLGDFTFNDVQYADRSRISLKDYSGRWLVLDFWNRYCSTCLKRMPHLDSLQQAYKSNVSFLLVGYTGSRYTKRSDNKEVRVLYERYKMEQRLNLAIAYDSLLFHRLNIGACPFIVIIDPKGVVRAVTTSIEAKEINSLLTNKPVLFEKAYRRDEYRQKVNTNKRIE